MTPAGTQPLTLNVAEQPVRAVRRRVTEEGQQALRGGRGYQTLRGGRGYQALRGGRG
jgi:hypothetical protein